MTGSSETIREFLIRTPFFGGLDDEGLDRIIAALRESAFKAGANVFREGDTGRSMYVIARGEVVMCRTGDTGHMVKLFRLHEGDFFGETTLIEMQPRPYTAQVARDATLYELTNMDLYKLYREDVKSYVMVLQNINRELCRRLRRSDTRITEIACEAEDEVTQIGTAFKKPK
ncbi:MAG: cyclic nucleotide-binding domain-containing protein [Myxococcales bacterium]